MQGELGGEIRNPSIGEFTPSTIPIVYMGSSQLELWMLKGLILVGTVVCGGIEWRVGPLVRCRVYGSEQGPNKMKFVYVLSVGEPDVFG